MKRKGVAAKVAYPAVLGALSLIFVYIGSVVPAGNWGLVAVAGVFPTAALISVGLKAGVLCWVGTSILSFLLLPGKFCALLYAALFGLYPIVKSLIEQIRRKGFEFLLKLAFFNASFSFVYLVMKTAVLDSLPSFFGTTGILYLMANVVFLIYDFGFSKLIGFYIARIGRAMK